MLETDITYDIKNIKEYMDENKMNEFLNFILSMEKENSNEDFYISLLITGNETIKKINKEYRDIDSETDVISFAYNETENIAPVSILGDIVISHERVIEQAGEYNHSEEREFYYVLCHGVLHLLGYDHMNDNDKKIMREKEEEILNNFNYIR